jgi:hypothetical protein
MKDVRGIAVVCGLCAGAVVLALVMLFCRSATPGREHVIVGMPLTVGDGDVVKAESSTVTDSKIPDCQKCLRLEPVTRDGGSVMRIRFPRTGDQTLTVTRKDTTVIREISVASRSDLFWNLAGLLLLVLVLPPVFFPRETSTPKSWIWTSLLTEAGGGLSLARCQLLLWYIPVAVIYLGTSLACHRLLPFDGTFATLFALSGVTSLVGTATSPDLSQRSSDSTADLRDLIEDWGSRADLSRYQYLFLSLGGVGILIGSFFENLEIPELPTQFVYLIAASQGTYLAVKAVKTSRISVDGEVSAINTARLAPSEVRRGAIAAVPVAGNSNTGPNGAVVPPAGTTI